MLGASGEHPREPPSLLSQALVNEDRTWPFFEGLDRSVSRGDVDAELLAHVDSEYSFTEPGSNRRLLLFLTHSLDGSNLPPLPASGAGAAANEDVISQPRC